MKEIIITSSVLILCIMLIRLIFKGKISSRLQYALWLLVVLRLVIPSSAQIYMAMGSIEEFRIMDLVEMFEEKVGDVTENLERPIAFTMSFNSPLAGKAAEFMLREDLDLPESMDGPTSYFVAGKIGASWLDLLRGIWIGGMILVAGWVIVTNVFFSRRLHKGRKEFTLPEGFEELLCGKKVHKVRLYTIEQLVSPCLYGLPGREAVYLTEDIVQDRDKLRHVLTHEMCHKKHGDSFWAILRSVLVIIYWMNPLVWVAAVLSKRDCELACDEEALLTLGEEERISYGETLLSIITRKGRLSDIACTATTMTGSGRSVKERIKLIAEKPRVLGVTVMAVLVLVIAISVAVFTKNPLFHGYTWEGDMTLTSGDMQVKLPATIAGISGYDTERNGDDIIVYQVSSGKEAGRFSVISYEEAVVMVNEGREIVPVGDYGLNTNLKSYMDSPHMYTPQESTTHLYGSDRAMSNSPVPYEEDVDDSDNWMLNTDWEVMPLEETEDYIPDEQKVEESSANYGYLPNEQITQTEILPGNSVTMHNYTTTDAAENYNQEAVDRSEPIGVPGTDSNDDTTYLIDDGIETGIATEESKEYLPNEQISSVFIPADTSTGKCYVYVKADYTGVKEKYLQEMEYINSELEIAAGHVIVISINETIRDEMFAVLSKNRTEYLGDASKVGALVNALPQPEGLLYQSIELHTLQTDPETALSLEINYDLTAEDMEDVDADMMFFNGAMLFATIRNLDECVFNIRSSEDEDSYRVEDIVGSDESRIKMLERRDSRTYQRSDLEKELGALWSDAASDSDENYVIWLEDIYESIVDFLK